MDKKYKNWKEYIICPLLHVHNLFIYFVLSLWKFHFWKLVGRLHFLKNFSSVNRTVTCFRMALPRVPWSLGYLFELCAMLVPCVLLFFASIIVYCSVLCTFVKLCLLCGIWNEVLMLEHFYRRDGPHTVLFLSTQVCVFTNTLF